MSFGTKVGLGTGGIVLDRDPAPPFGKGHSSHPTFWPMSTVSKRSPISTTAKLLFSQDFAGKGVHKVLVESYQSDICRFRVVCRCVALTLVVSWPAFAVYHFIRCVLLKVLVEIVGALLYVDFVVLAMHRRQRICGRDAPDNRPL